MNNNANNLADTTFAGLFFANLFCIISHLLRIACFMVANMANNVDGYRG